MNWFQKASRLLGDVFLPIIPILVATGLFMGVRSLITNLGVTLDPTALTLSQVLIDTAFAFLPALVTYSVMKKVWRFPGTGHCHRSDAGCSAAAQRQPGGCR